MSLLNRAIDTVRTLLALPAKVEKLADDVLDLTYFVKEHIAKKGSQAHNFPYWMKYDQKQLDASDFCSECGFRWPRGGVETHFKDPANNEQCPRAK